MINIAHKCIVIALLLGYSCVLNTLADNNEINKIIKNANEYNEKSKSTSEEVIIVEIDNNDATESKTNDGIATSPNKYSEPISNIDPSSGIKILTAPDLSKPRSSKEEDKDNIKHNIDNFPDFGKLILDSDNIVSKFVFDVKSAYKNVHERHYENNQDNELEEGKSDLEKAEDMLMKRFGERMEFEKKESEMTEEEKRAHTIFTVANALIKSRTGSKKQVLQMLTEAAQHNDDAKLELAWGKLFGTSWTSQDIQSANKSFHELAEKGIPGGQMGLGFLYSAGIGVNVSQAKSLVYYTFSAIGGNPWAQMALGYRYYSGMSVSMSCEKALDFYKIAAAKVAKEVTLSGGQMVHRVRLMEESDSSSYNAGILDKDLFEYYQLLANKGDVTAQVGLGQLHFQGGRGIPLDYQKAHHYFVQAAEANNAIALGFLGRMYLEGNEYVHQDNKTAYAYFKKSADQNNPVGQSGLGLMYLRGQGVDQDYAEAFKYFQLAAEQGWVDGQLNLGIMYYSGLGVRRDFKAAIKYFNLASQSGHVLAFYNLAQMHATGTGLMRSCSTAVDLFKNVVERGRWGEKLMEGYNHYRDGHMNEAFVLYAMLSDLGYDVAQSNAAYMLDKGDISLWEDESESYMRALMYWGRSAAQGYSPAQVKLGDYHYYGLGTPVDYEMAAMHYRLASETQHNAQAFFNLGYMHEQGLGMAQDMHLAKRCYDMAAETNVDAKVPVALALVKLSIFFTLKYLRENRWEDWLMLLNVESQLGDFWDLYLLCLLVGVLAVIFYLKRRGPPHPHQD